MRGLTRLQWVDDPVFDSKHHIHHRKLPKPGSPAALERLVSKIFSEHLDLGRPLWEVWVVDGLEGGKFAVIAKTHYALLEGLTGVELVTLLFDLHGHQSRPTVPPEPAREPDPLPSSLECWRPRSPARS